MKKIILSLLVLFSAIWAASIVDAAIIIGRISNVEGQIYRYMDVDDSWVETSLQSPAGSRDLLATGDDSRAEIIFPNNQLVRLDESTEIEILNLDDDLGEFTLHSGFARFYNRNSAGKLLIETAMGTVTVEAGNAVDVLADKKSVTVSAVHGEAVFHSYQDGVEKVEVISESTRLEFREDSIIAGTGTIDRKWDRWCANRERVLAQNRLVRSEHLPESMQEYAYTLEPNGGWQRIYYRGYYYWAWKPHSVSTGWSPYTTGYWDDWHGSAVWVDNHPWGWATHHHGHWLNMHGAWLWTPYVHVSHVSGVTAIGFSITFGKGYRSHWHPGRVRWIAHNDYIGWLPLAPWETYYGQRKWGPRSVRMQRGASFSININLSNHKHLKHAVIIPKHHLYNRKPRVRNNYNTVKIKNVNKTVIIKNYKPLQRAERLRQGKHSAKVTRNINTEKKIENRRKTAGKTKEITRNNKQENKRIGSVRSQRKISKARTVTGKNENGSKRTIKNKKAGAIENKRVAFRAKAPRKKVARPEQRIHARTAEKKDITSVKNRVAARNVSRKSIVNEDKKLKKDKKTRQAQTETGRKYIRNQENKSGAVQRNKVEARKHTGKESRLSQRKAMPNQKNDRQINKEKSSKDRGEDLKKENSEKQISGNFQKNSEKKLLKANRENKQKTDRDFYSASLKSRRFR